MEVTILGRGAPPARPARGLGVARSAFGPRAKRLGARAKLITYYQIHSFGSCVEVQRGLIMSGGGK